MICAPTALIFVAALSLSPVQAAASPGRAPASYSIEVLKELPHEGAVFTQGLEFTGDGSLLVETSGSFPQGTKSKVRTLDPGTGAVVSETTAGMDEGRGRFAEGIVQLDPPDGNWFASTFQDDVVAEYDARTLEHVADHRYHHEGWGLTRSADRASFLATNGSEIVMTLRPDTFEVLDAKPAMCFGERVSGINELEMVDDFMGRGPALLGNLYRTRLVVALDPATMQCTGVFDLGVLGDVQDDEKLGYHVANGIAFNTRTGTFMLTGKNWEKMFEVSLNVDPKGGAAALLRQSLRKVESSFLQRSGAP